MPRDGNNRPALLEEITPDLTIPKVFVRVSQQLGSKVALREKEYGVWRPITWAQYHERVRKIALGLHALGIGHDDKVAMIGDNRPEGLMAEMATLCIGGVAVWLYQESLIDEVQYVVDHSDTKVMFCEGQEEVDKALRSAPNARSSNTLSGTIRKACAIMTMPC
jgi:long-chain acyl-CoA synthetase